MGKCIINKYNYFSKGLSNLSKNKNYFYNYILSEKNSIIELPKNYLNKINIIKSNKNKKIKIQNKYINISDGCSLNNIKNKSILFPFSGSQILIVGSKKNKNAKFKKTLYKNHYKVKKPWGYELWINEDKSNHVLKEIFIKKIFKTSLKYHNFKSETNLLYNGIAELFYKKNSKIKNLNVQKKDIGKIRIKKYSTMHVTPKVLHRIKAVTDIKLFEASTNFLDDVIRVSDETNRKSGRIKSEHTK